MVKEQTKRTCLKHANCGKKASWPELETDLLGWVTEKRNIGLAVLPLLVRFIETQNGK